MVPYIFEDYCTERQVADAFMKIYELTPEEKADLKVKMADYLEHEFKYENMIKAWDETMLKCVEDFKTKKESGNLKRWKLNTIQSSPAQQLVGINKK